MFKLYNDLNKKQEKFQPLKDKKVGIYVCGPTIYDYGHLGHGRSAVAFDLLRRYLLYKGYKVNYVFNYTDIEDKMIKRANKKDITVKKLADKFTKIYDEDYAALNVLPPDHKPKPTQHIKQIINLVKKLEKKGYTYVIEGEGVYYDIEKFDDYGKLSHQSIEDLQAGARVEVDERKKNPHDFVLWKFKKEGEPAWDSPWGEGRPGWHIECSAMSMEYIGDTLDIHGGGRDLIFPHHEDEIAQSEAATDKPFAKYWVHNGFVQIEKEKMSKSLDNFFTLREIFKKFDPLVVRFFFLQTHYRDPINFTMENLENAKNTLDKLQRFYQELMDTQPQGDAIIDIPVYRTKFEEAMDEDLNVTKAIEVLSEAMTEFYKKKDNLEEDSLSQFQQLIRDIESVFAVMEKEEQKIPQEVIKLAEQRQEARQNKNFDKADQLRDKIKEKGYQVNDTPEGYKLEEI